MGVRFWSWYWLTSPGWREPVGEGFELDGRTEVEVGGEVNLMVGVGLFPVAKGDNVGVENGDEVGEGLEMFWEKKKAVEIASIIATISEIRIIVLLRLKNSISHFTNKKAVFINNEVLHKNKRLLNSELNLTVQTWNWSLYLMSLIRKSESTNRNSSVLIQNSFAPTERQESIIDHKLHLFLSYSNNYSLCLNRFIILSQKLINKTAQTIP